MNLEQIQAALREQAIDGWLFFDHHRRDPVAYRVLGLADDLAPTRRWYYFVPADGEPRGLVHRIEPYVLDSLPGTKLQYASWKSQQSALQSIIGGSRRVAMQYSPQCAIPYVSNVDAGTVELVRQCGVTVVSSADLVQQFEARWSEDQIRTHFQAQNLMDGVRARAFEVVRQAIRDRVRLTEFDVHQFLREQFRAHDLVTDHGPIVAVNQNASDPHYEPSADRHSEINRGDLILIDMWAKLNKPRSVYYDITWTAFCGEQPSDEMIRVFEVVRSARDRGIQTVQQAVTTRVPLKGFEVDDAVRKVIASEGFGEYFFHRTGHSIGEDVHGAGANMDNLETHDERVLLPNTCFSIEPGVYLPTFGIRSEVNVLVREDRADITGESQSELLRLV